MKGILKIRLLQPCFFMSIIILICVLFISWFFESYFAEIMFFMDYDAPDLKGVSPLEVKQSLLQDILTWERYIDASMRYVVNFLPIFAILPTIPFLKEVRSYFILGANRFINYRKELMKAIAFYSIRGGIGISIAFVIYFSIGNLFVIPSIDDIGGFASIFPKDFYSQHPYLFFVFMALTIYFVIGFVFAFMACGLILFTEKELFILVIPLAGYFISNYLGYAFNLLPFKISESICAFNTLYSTSEIFIPVIPLLIIDVILLYFGIRKKRGAIDVS